MRQELRRAVLERDDYTCQYCGARPKLLTLVRAGKTHTTLHVDHMIPKVRGGQDSLWNLVAACRGCNMAKKDRRWPFPLAYCSRCGHVERDVAIRDDERMGYPMHTCEPCTIEINAYRTEPADDIDEIAAEVAAWDYIAEAAGF